MVTKSNRNLIIVVLVSVCVFMIVALLFIFNSNRIEFVYVVDNNKLEYNNHTIAHGDYMRVEKQISNEKALYSIDNKILNGKKIPGRDLYEINTKTFENRKIESNIVSTSISDDKNLMVITNNDNEVWLLDDNYNKLAKIGKNGSGAIISHDGKYVVYQKLADSGVGYYDLSMYAQGLSVYDINNKTEKLITTNPYDYMPIGFSLDMSKLYFAATRMPEGDIKDIAENHIVSFWIHNMKTGEDKRLNNNGDGYGLEMSYISNKALWSSDRKTVITDGGDNDIYIIQFDDNGNITKNEKIGFGNILAWDKKDTSVYIYSLDSKKIKIINVI